MNGRGRVREKKHVKERGRKRFREWERKRA
jgi:hypothetical protein